MAPRETANPACMGFLLGSWHWVTLHEPVKWCRHQESNPGPTDYKSVALPAELYRRGNALYRVGRICKASLSKKPGGTVGGNSLSLCGTAGVGLLLASSLPSKNSAINGTRNTPWFQVAKKLPV